MLDLIREHPATPRNDAGGLPALVAAGSAKIILSQADPVIARLGLVLDELWFPGGFAADADGEILSRIHSEVATSDSDAGVAADITALAASWRFLVIGSTRVDAERGAAAARRMAGDLERHGRRQTDPGLVAHLHLVAADIFRLGGVLDQAGDSLQRAAAAFGALGDQVGIGRCHLLVADSRLSPWSSPELFGVDPWDLSRNPTPVEDDAAQAAMAACDAAEEAFAAVGASRGLAAVSVRRAYCAWRRADPAGVLVHAAAARSHADVAGDLATLLLAQLFELLAGIDIGEAGDLRRCFPAEVVAWSRERGSASFARGLAVLGRAAGRRWLDDGRPEDARIILTVAFEIAEGLGHPDEQLAGLEALGALYGALSNRGPALGTLHRVYRRHRSRVDRAEDWMQAAAVLSSIEAHYLAESDTDGLAWVDAEAIALLGSAPERPVGSDTDLFQESRRRFEDLPAQGRRRVAADGRPADPRFGAEMAASIAGTLQDTLDQNAVGAPMLRAIRARRAGRDQEAEAGFRRALAEAERLGPRGRSWHAMVLLAARRYDEATAEILCLRDIDGYPDDLVTDMLRTAGRYDLVTPPVVPPRTGTGWWRSVLGAAETLLGRDESDRAADLLTLARDDFEHWYAGLRRDPFRLAAADDVNARWLYLLSAQAALRRNRPEEFVALGDRLRSLALLCLMAEPPGPWARANAMWSTAFDVVAHTGRHAASAADTDDPALTRLAGRSPDEVLDRAQARLEAAGPAAARTRLPGGLDVEELRRVLPPGTILLSLLFAGDRLLHAAVGAEALEVAQTRYDSDRLIGHAGRLRDAGAGRWVPGDAEASRRELGRLILQPFDDLLRPCRRVIVAPGSELLQIPFGLLPLGDGLLADDRAISVLPAAALLTVRRPAPTGDVLVVGDPGSIGLPRLPGTAVEARGVADRYGTQPLIGAQATAAAVAARLPGARIVHLATHGLLSEIAPTASSVALHGPDRLAVSDLAGLRMDAELVVLSACDSGRGDATIGGDVVGLARQLLAIGARTVVASLWPVGDVATCVLMDEFHRRYCAVGDAAGALGGAQEQIRTMTPAEIADRYRALAGPAVAVPVPPRRRGLIAQARDWAGFVTVGA